MQLTVKLFAAGLGLVAATLGAQAAPPPAADLTVLASRGQLFTLVLDGRLLTGAATQQVHVSWLAPGRHWADVQVFSPYGPPVGFRTTVWLQPGLDSRYVLTISPYGPSLQSLGAVVAGGYAYRGGYGNPGYGAPGSYGTTPYPAYPQGNAYPAPVPPQGSYATPVPYDQEPAAPYGGYSQPVPNGGYNQPMPNGGYNQSSPNGSYNNQPAPNGSYSQPPAPNGGYNNQPAPAPNGGYTQPDPSQAPRGSYAQPVPEAAPQSGYRPAPNQTPNQAPKGSYPQPAPSRAPEGAYTQPAPETVPQGGNAPEQSSDYPADTTGGALAPLAPTDVRDLTKELHEQPTDEARFDVIRPAFEDRSLQASELSELMQEFSTEPARIELAELGYPHLSDPDNMAPVYAQLRPASVVEVRRTLELRRN
ncbi:MAG: DUF4476 domain-containing protein [Janthinobacterium lividum]